MEVDLQHAEFLIRSRTPERILLEDLGPWDKRKTITQDAQWVINQLGWLLPSQRILYYNTRGQLWELMVVDGNVGFSMSPLR